MSNEAKEIDRIKVISWGRESLLLEAETLNTAGNRLGDSFADAISIILRCHGKIVLTGLGKSGHIANKIASTLASTGTPAFYLHPSEALHGDLGMIGKDDCLLAIAFGGETAEVIAVASFARKSGVPVIALTGNLSSSLAKLAEVVLDGKVQKETCPHNLAPTSSSLLALALGDAIAVTLMRARGFSMDQFAALHPAGSLGRRLSVVGDYLQTDGQWMISEEADFNAVLDAITSQNHGIVGIVDKAGLLIGAVSDGDVRRAIRKYQAETLKRTARELMTVSPKTISRQALAIDGLRTMEKFKISSLFVVDEDVSVRPIGILKLNRLLEAKL